MSAALNLHRVKPRPYTVCELKVHYVRRINMYYMPLSRSTWLAGGAFNTQVHPLIRFAAAAATCLASSSIKRRLHPHCNPSHPQCRRERQRARRAARVLVGGCSPHFYTYCAQLRFRAQKNAVAYFSLLLQLSFIHWNIEMLTCIRFHNVIG